MEGNTAFSSTVPKLQIAWDSVSLGLLKECPRKYQYTLIEGWQHKKTSHHLVFGIWYHSSLEKYDRARAKGASHDDALRQAVSTALEISGTRNEDGTFSPYISDDKNKTRETLVRTVIWYLEQFSSDPAETIILDNGQPAVELSFRFDTHYSAPDGQNYILCGHLDRMVNFAGDAYVMDRKTTKGTISSNYFDQFHPDSQMSQYTVAGKVVYNLPVRGVIIDAAQIGVTFSRFERAFASRTQGELDEWMQDTFVWLRQNETFVEADHWPMNDKSCSKYGGCVFLNVCNKDPSVRKTFLEADFVKRIWDPLQVRGE